MARKRTLTQTEEGGSTFRLTKIIKHVGRVLQVECAPNASQFPNLCAFLFTGAVSLLI